MQKKYVSSAKEAFDRYLAEGKPAYVARELPAPAEAITWIREAKGVAVLAHPTWIKDGGDGLRGCVSALKDAGLDGVEVHYSTHSKSQTSSYLELAQRLDLLQIAADFGQRLVGGEADDEVDEIIAFEAHGFVAIGGRHAQRAVDALKCVQRRA